MLFVVDVVPTPEGLITQRSLVQIQPPQPANDEGLADAVAANPFSFTQTSPRNWFSIRLSTVTKSRDGWKGCCLRIECRERLGAGPHDFMDPFDVGARENDPVLRANRSLPASRRAATGYRIYCRIRTNRSTTWSPDGVLAKHRLRRRASEPVLSLIDQLLGAAAA